MRQKKNSNDLGNKKSMLSWRWFVFEKLNEKIIEYLQFIIPLIKKYENNKDVVYTALTYIQLYLHYASSTGNEIVVKLLLDTFNEEFKEDQLIEFVMKEDDNKKMTALHHASLHGHEKS